MGNVTLMEKLTQQMVNDATGSRAWDLGNETLYELCRKHPEHTDEQAIIAKVWLIGRSYAAAIERRKPNANETFEGGNFYTDNVVTKILKSPIDKWFSDLKDLKGADEQTMGAILNVHCELTNLFEKISGLENRSLVSKYLHFHFRHLFFIYDARAVSALRGISSGIARGTYADIHADGEYRNSARDACARVISLKKNTVPG